MTKWQLDSDGRTLDYPTLGFTATDAAILDGSLSNPVLSTAPDARWTEYLGASAETGITRWGELVHPPAPAEPTDGSMLLYDATANRFAPSTAAEVFANSGFGAALDTTTAANLTDTGSASYAAQSAAIEAQGIELFGPVVTPESYGAVGDGVTNDTPAIQSMFDALRTGGVPRFVRFREGANYYLAGEVEVNADYVSVQAHGAKFTGPAAGTPEGGLVTIVDRADLTRTVEWVSWFGGTFRTQHADDNGLNVVAAQHVLIDGSMIDMTAGGQYGMALQTNQTLAANLRWISLVNIETEGGEQGIDITSSGIDRKITDVTVRGCRAVNASGIAFKASASNLAYRLSRIHFDGIEAVDCTYGVQFYYIEDGTVRNLTVTGGTGYGLAGAYNDRCTFAGLNILGRTTGRGMQFEHPDDCHASDILITGSSATDMGLSLSTSIARDGFTLDNVRIHGTFTTAFYNGIGGVTARGFDIKDATVGIDHAGTADAAVYDGFTFEGVTTPVDAYRAGDSYERFYTRSAGVLTNISRSGLAAVTVNIVAYTAQTGWATLATTHNLNSSGAQNNEITYSAYLTAGTWTFRLGHLRSANRGIYDVQVDGVSVGTIDGYNASTVDGINTITGIAVASAGVHTLRLVMSTQNASSSGYFGSISHLAFMKTA